LEIKIKNTIYFSGKIILLAVLMTVIFIILSSFLMQSAATETTQADGAKILVLLFIVNLVNISIIIFVIKQSSWQGRPLMVGLAISFFGVLTFMAQIEAVFFLTDLAVLFGAGTIPVIDIPLEIIGGQFVIGLVLAMTVVPLAVIMFGKNKKNSSAGFKQYLKATLANKQWIWKSIIIVISYELLYFGFGYYVAWQNPAVLEFYQGTDPGSFFLQLKYVFTQTPLLVLVQLFRALAWAGFALPVIHMTKSNKLTGTFATALMVSIPMNIQHILPNAFMPAEVSRAHFIETAISTFIFGIILFWVLHKDHSSSRD